MLCSRMICIISMVLALSLVGNVQAGNTSTSNWTDADTGDHLWSTAGNWDALPDSGAWVKVRNGIPGATIAIAGAQSYKISIGYDDWSVLTMDGGSLSTVEDLALGWNEGTGTLEMVSGIINCGRDLEVGRGADGTLNMTGGTITVADDLMIPEAGTTNTAEVNLDGGTIIVNGDLMMLASGSLNITAGTLIIDGNAVSIVQGYISSGWITAYQGSGTINMDYGETNSGKTTVTATDDPPPSTSEIVIVPSGTSDDTNLIQTALDRLQDGDTLRLNGDFVIASTIYLPSNITWILAGTLTLGDNADLDRVGYVDPSKGIDARRSTGISETPGGATNIDMSGGTYYGNYANNSSSLRFLNFVSATNSYFHDMIITDVSDDNFTLGPGCNNNECRNLISSFAGGNALTDKGDHNTWYDCIAADCFGPNSDGWTPKCRYSTFVRCIAANNVGPGFGMYAREEGYAQDVGSHIIGNQFIDCVSYGSRNSSGFSFNISSNCPGAIIRDNFIQAVCYDNQKSGVMFRNKDDAETGIIENNVVDIVCYGNKGLSKNGSPNTWAGGLGIENDNSTEHNTIENITGSVVCYDNRIDVNTKGGLNCNITAYHPSGENAPVLEEGDASNIITVIGFNCSDKLDKWCAGAYCKLHCGGLTDLNCDGIVDIADLSYMADVWLTDDSTSDIALPADGIVNLLDFSILFQ